MNLLLSECVAHEGSVCHTRPLRISSHFQQRMVIVQSKGRPMTTTRGIVCWHKEGIPRKYRIVIRIVLTCRLRLAFVRAPSRNRPTPSSTAAPSLCAIGQIREPRELACAGGHLHRGQPHRVRVRIASQNQMRTAQSRVLAYSPRAFVNLSRPLLRSRGVAVWA